LADDAVVVKEGLGRDIAMVAIKDGNADISTTIEKAPRVREVRKQDGIYKIKVKDGEETAPAIIEATKMEGHTVSRISLTKPTLDEVYMEYARKSMREEKKTKEGLLRQRAMMQKARSG
jgi:ABC-2 type transport system ATP-binding protein